MEALELLNNFLGSISLFFTILSKIKLFWKNSRNGRQVEYMVEKLSQGTEKLFNNIKVDFIIVWTYLVFIL